MRKTIAAAAVLSACALLLGACAGNGLAAKDAPCFGTQARWVYVPSEIADADAVMADLTARAHSVEADISAEQAQSSVARFNAAAAGERVPIGEEAFEVLTAARAVYAETEGDYNPAAGRLVDLWGFSPRFHGQSYLPVQPYDREDFTVQLPEEKYIAAFSQECLLDFGAVGIGKDEEGYYAEKPASASVTVDGTVYTMQLDLGGIGKGYCADEATAILRAAGQTSGYYNLGASSMRLFADPTRSGGVWEVSVNSPRPFFASANYATLRLRDTAISTSGDHEQYYEYGGVRYCHIVDPATGYPIGAAPGQDGSHVVCVSVVGGSAAEGDARATALSCMGLEQAKEYAARHADEFRVLFVWLDARTGTYTAYTNLDAAQCSINIPAEVIA